MYINKNKMENLIEAQKIELQNILAQKKELETKSLNLCLDILKANNNSIRLDEESINYDSMFKAFDESAEKIITYIFVGAEFCPYFGLLILGIRSDNTYIDCDDIRDIRPDEIESMDFAMIAEYLINYISNK